MSRGSEDDHHGNVGNRDRDRCRTEAHREVGVVALVEAEEGDAQGQDERPVVTFSEPKSISRETTFERDLLARQDRAALGAIFTRLCEQLAADLQRKGYLAKTIGVKLRYDDFRIATRELTLEAHTNDARTIRQTAGRCLKKAVLEQRIRLLGVRAGGLCKASNLPPPPRSNGTFEQRDQLLLPIFEGSARTTPGV